jgi:hypothetical protein
VIVSFAFDFVLFSARVNFIENSACIVLPPTPSRRAAKAGNKDKQGNKIKNGHIVREE